MMKKFLASLIMLMLVVSGAWGAYYDEANDGSSWGTAYLIKSADDLKLMRDRVNGGYDTGGAYYKLVNDVDLSSETSWQGIGTGNRFTGHFDGQNHTIKLNINDEFIDTGLFYQINTEDGEIAVRNLNISGNIHSNWAGGLTWGMDSGIIENCSFTGTISVSGEWAGGFVDLMYGGVIRNCRVNAKISSLQHSGGGFVAELYGGNIENCTAEAGTEITGSAYSGGIVGLMHGGEVRNSSSSVVLNGSGLKGGIVGGADTSVSQNLSGNTWPNIYNQIGLVADDLPDDPTSDDINNNPVVNWNGHKYQVFNENLTWEQAKSRCEALGGHLATITSQAEQDKIEELINNSELNFYGYWLGAKADNLGFWHWVTDEVFERQYTNFASNQPDGSGNYLQIFAQVPSSDEDDDENNENNDDENDHVVERLIVSTPDNEDFYVIGKWDDTTTDGTNSGIITEHGFICEWDDEPEDVEAAELNSDFLTWQADPEAWSADNDSGDYYGARPSPEDFSHLADNPPSETNFYPSSVFRAKQTASYTDVRYDPRESSALPPVRKQSPFNTCWAFASIGAMEIDYITQKMSSLGNNPDLSELHLAWFTYMNPDYNYELPDKNESVLNQMGNADIAINVMTDSLIMPVDESNMPYSEAGSDEEKADSSINNFLGNKGAGSFDKAKITLINHNIIGDDFINKSDFDDVKKNIINHGSVYFEYYDNPNGRNAEHNSYYYTALRGSQLHAALLVGWDDNYSADNFDNSPGENGAWLVRDSRGSDKEAEDGGYFWLSYAQADKSKSTGLRNGRAFIVQEVSEDITNKSSDNNGTYIHKHDNNGKTKNISYQWSAGIFQAGRNEDIFRVVFPVTDNNAKYEVFINTFGKIRPENPGQTGTPLITGEVSRVGNCRVNLPSSIPVYKGDYYSVIVKIILQSEYKYPTGVEAKIDKYVSPDVREGNSFFATGEPVPSLWQDGAKIEGGPYDACIRVYTRPRVSYETAPVITTSTLPDTTEGQEYNFTLTASGTSPIEWRSGNLPAGLGLTRDGIFTGQVTEAGEYIFNVTALNNVSSDTKTFTLKVNVDPMPKITSSTLPDAKEGEKYSYTLTASGTQPIEWQCSNLPAGINLSSTGLLSGTPSTRGEYSLNITASNQYGTDTKTFTLKVNKPDDQQNFSSTSSSSGCNSGLNALCLISLLGLFIKRR